MLTKKFKHHFAWCHTVEQSIRHADVKALDATREQLMDKMGQPFGVHTRGVPLIIATLTLLLGFAMVQIRLWELLFSGFSAGPHNLFFGILPTALIFAVVLSATVYFIAQGYMAAVSLFLSMAKTILILDLLYFVLSLYDFMLNKPYAGAQLISALLGILFIILAFLTVNAPSFRVMLTLMLHNRIWRRQLQLKRQALTRR
ncbi:hypothetical protein [Pantoea sp. FN0307]|uniref:hypothetical protein n=1 Tax=Pantoea sp. FN0307 TaxID=3418560 RepID=UPI003CFB2C58